MIKYFLLLPVLSFLFLPRTGESSESFLMEKGFRLPIELVSQSYTLMKLSPLATHIKEHIVKTNYKVPSGEAEVIAKDILAVSSCFEIDPWILTSLIQKESSFVKQAVSPTGAVGLTQFTSIGIKEVNDQLGHRGREGAPEVVTLFFHERLRDCINPSWSDLWNRIEIQDNHPEFYKQLKEIIKNDGQSSIVYGAVLLKIYLAFVNYRNTYQVAPLKLSEVYFQALQLYNGEEGEAKLRYAKAIFKNLKLLYPNEVNFPY